MALSNEAKGVALLIAGQALRALGFALYAGAAFCSVAIFGGVISKGYLVFRNRLSIGEIFSAALGMLLAFVVAGLVMNGGQGLLLLGKRLVAKRRAIVSHRLMTTPDEPIVLYLRSFHDDDAAASTPVAYVYRGTSFQRLSTEEEHLARAVRGLGQLLALAESATLPHAGALRLPAEASEWQDTIRELMQRAKLVLVRMGGGYWLWWETEQALALVPRERLVFLIPNEGSVWDSFRGKLEAALQRPLPVLLDVSPVEASIAAFLSFEHDGSPALEPLRDPGPRASLFQPLRPMLRIALRPVFERLKAPWTPPPVPFQVIVPVLIWGYFVMPCVYFLFCSPWPRLFVEDWKAGRWDECGIMCLMAILGAVVLYKFWVRVRILRSALLQFRKLPPWEEVEPIVPQQCGQTPKERVKTPKSRHNAPRRRRADSGRFSSGLEQ